MLNGISVENYKAFEKGSIKVKPITIYKRPQKTLVKTIGE